MKNLKKLISVVLCLAVLAGCLVVGTSAATYGDVDETQVYYADVELLSALGIVQGDENGNFNPEADVKRSELAAMICRALGQESAATSTVSKFPDVSSDHWAVGYIGWAAGKEIVNGYEDGTFKADNAVTYQEAVKMLMCALGYRDLAESDSYGGYPYGYLSLAGTYGVTAGISANPTEAASRALIAQLIANALDAPLMDKGYTYLGQSYVIYDGKKAADYEERTILSHYLDIIKVRAEVVNNFKSKDSLVKKDGRQQVELSITKVYNVSDQVDYEEELYNGDYYEDNLAVYAGDTNAADFLASEVDAYITYNEDDELELVAIIGNDKATETLTVDKDIDTVNATASAVTFTYWEDIENDSRATEVDIDPTAEVFVNGTKIGALNASADARAALNAVTAPTFEGTIQFVGSKGEDFTNIFITTYIYGMVDSVNIEDEAIELTDGYVELGEDYTAKGFVYNIYKNGEAITLEDIKEDDVLTFVWPGGAQDADALYVDIYVSDATVEGVVTGAKSNDSVYYIDRVEYKTANGVTLKVGDEGVFYLTHDGKVYDSKATSSLSDNYAYILKVGMTENFGDNSYQLRIFDKNGATATYDIADSVKVTANFGGTVETKTLKVSDGTQDALFIDAVGEGYTAPAAETDVFAYNIPALLAAEADEGDASDKAALRLITFGLNGDEINKISFPVLSGEEGQDFNYNTANTGYKAATSRLGSYYFEDTTSLFYAPVKSVTGGYGIDVDDVALLSFASLDEDASYTAFAYAYEKKYMGAALVVNELPFAGRSSALAVVTSVAEGLNAENDKAVEITVFQSGKTDAYILDEDVDETVIQEGDIIQFVLNGSGEISQAEVVYNYGVGLTPYTAPVPGNDITFVAGYATYYKNGGITINNVYAEGGAEYSFNYETGCTLAMVDVAKEGTNSFVKGLNSTSAFKYTQFNSVAPVQYFIVARLEDGDILDAVEYNYGNVAPGPVATPVPATAAPTAAPTDAPTDAPTAAPTEAPTPAV